jgi:hypothetical protein
MTAKSFALSEWLSVSDVWIGLAEVEQRPGAGVLMDENKAFVQVLALASDEREYRSVAAAALDDLASISSSSKISSALQIDCVRSPLTNDC